MTAKFLVLIASVFVLSSCQSQERKYVIEIKAEDDKTQAFLILPNQNKLTLPCAINYNQWLDLAQSCQCKAGDKSTWFPTFHKSGRKILLLCEDEDSVLYITSKNNTKIAEIKERFSGKNKSTIVIR